MILLILILAFILRLINLNQSLWLDEAVQAITAQKNISYIFQEITGDFHPPLYYFLMHYWVQIFGSSEIALRMPSVIFGVGTVYLVYKINGLTKLRINGLITALFLATAPFHIYYSQEARMYSMVTFFTSLSMFYFIKIFTKTVPDQQPSSKCKVQSFDSAQDKRAKLKFTIQSFEYLLFIFASILMIYSDYYGFLILLTQNIFLFLNKKYKYLILNTLYLILFYLPWLPMFIKQIKTGMLATKILPGWGKLVNVSFFKAIPLTIIKFTIGRITVFNKTIYAFISGLIIIVYGILITNGYLKNKKSPMSNHQSPITNHQLLITLWFFVPLIVSWTASLFVPNFQPFRLLLILPAFYMILAMGIEKILWNKWLKRSAIAAVLAINLVSSSVYFLNPYFWREDWKGLTKYLVGQKDSTVILPSSASNWPIKYYDKEEKINLITGINGVGEIKSVDDFKKADNIYYIRYLVPLFDPNEQILANIKNQGYTKVKEISFNQIPLWEFELVTSD